VQWESGVRNRQPHSNISIERCNDLDIESNLSKGPVP
jgi:hypothetical protein